MFPQIVDILYSKCYGLYVRTSSGLSVLKCWEFWDKIGGSSWTWNCFYPIHQKKCASVVLSLATLPHTGLFYITHENLVIVNSILSQYFCHWITLPMGVHGGLWQVTMWLDFDSSLQLVCQLFCKVCQRMGSCSFPLSWCKICYVRPYK